MKINESILARKVMDFDFVKPRVIERLASKMTVDTASGTRILSPIKHTGLMMEYAVDVTDFNEEDDDNNAYLIINQEMLDSWGVQIPDIKVLSKINTPRLAPLHIRTISGMLGFSQEDEIPIIVVTNELLCRGAGAILYKNAYNEVRSILNDDFYIIPSSIHETLCVPKHFTNDANILLSMVCDVNDSDVVDNSEILDYNVYEFVDGFLQSAINR